MGGSASWLLSPPAPTDAQRRRLLAVGTADSRPSACPPATASTRVSADVRLRPLRKSRQRFWGIAFSPRRPDKSCFRAQCGVGSTGKDVPVGSPTERQCFVAARGSAAVAAEAVPNTAAGRGAAVFQALPAVSEDQSEGRKCPHTYSGTFWQCLGSVGSVWQY